MPGEEWTRTSRGKTQEAASEMAWQEQEDPLIPSLVFVWRTPSELLPC